MSDFSVGYMAEQLLRGDESAAPHDSAGTDRSRPDHLPWPALVTMSAATFVVVSVEMMPTAVLPMLAADLDVSLARAGLLVSAWALTVVVASFPLTRITARLPRAPLVAGALLVVALATVVTAAAEGYGLALGSRLVAAAATGLLWSAINFHAASLAPEHLVGRATAVVLFGGMLGTVGAIPAGNALAQWLGWRAPFAALAVLAALAAVAVLVVLPRFPARLGGRPDVGGAAARSGLAPLVVTAVLGAFLLLGHFTAFTFVTELLRPAGLPTPLLLLVFGLVGAAGVVLVGVTSDRYPRAVPIVLAGTLVISLAGLAVIGINPVLDSVVVVVWGVGVGAVGPVVQARLMRQAGTRHRGTAGALMPVAMNLGIALGAATGSAVLEVGSLTVLPVVALLPVVVALVGFVLLARRSTR